MSPFVRPRNVLSPPVRVVAFHHAGGSASVYYPLTRKLPQEWDVLILDLPGRGKRHALPALRSISEVVALAMRDLEPWMGAPLALFGHSYGAILACEVARALEMRGVPALWLGVSGRIAPSAVPVRRRLHELAEDDLFSELLKLGGTPERIHEVPEFRERFLAITRADLACVESYEPSPTRVQLSCAVTAFSGSHDSWALPSEMRAWGLETRGPFVQRVCHGGHFFFIGSAFDGLTTQIADDVERARADVRESPANVTRREPGKSFLQI